MKLYPVNLIIKNYNCLVVGCGKIAVRKINDLLKAGADVTVIADKINKKIDKLKCKRLNIIKRNFKSCDIKMKKFKLIIASTNNYEINKKIFDIADELNIPVNIVDIPELCNFYVPSKIHKGDLTVTISTNGKCPALSKYIRKKLEKFLEPINTNIIKNISKYRNKIIKQNISDLDKKKLINKKIKKELE